MSKKNIHVHFMGIGGSGLAGVAILAKSQGFKVSGCDLAKETYYTGSLKKVDIKPLVGHSAAHLAGVDILAVSPAVLDINPHHPEITEAKKRGILMTWQEFMGRYLQKNKFVIAVVGTHGKSTTTALMGLVLQAAGLDPTVEVGAMVNEWKATARVGKSKYFVCEGDEFNYNFLHYYPSIIIINNIEMDHPEFFKDFDQFRGAFRQFVQQIQKPKILIVNEESQGIQELLSEMRRWLKDKKIKIIGYYLKKSFDFPFAAEYRSIVNKIGPDFNQFRVVTDSQKNEFKLKIPGIHNIANALGVLAAAVELGIKPETAGKVFLSFTGLKRRFDLIGETRGVKVFDDYAVHPTAVEATIKAARQKYPQSRIWAVFEPHQFSRLFLFLDKFASALNLADKVVVTKIYPGREKDTGKIKTDDLIKKIGKKAVYYPDFEKLAEFVAQKIKKNDLVIVFGAGKSYLISKMILEKLKYQEFVPLAPYTTFKIGGPADLFYEAKTTADLIKAVKSAQERKIPFFVLGGGSNLLVNDSGFRGLVIAIRNTRYAIRDTRILAGAGISMRKLVEATTKNSLSGLEFMAGIPGTLGGAVRGNAGAWQQNIGDRVSRVRILTEKGEIKWLKQKDCQFQYRQSRFKKTKEIILEVELQLERGVKKEIKEKIEENLKKREGQPKEPSAGCVFINPKPLSAGKMIEECGLKGKRVGDAQISPRHANFIINLGQAKAKAVLQLIKLAKSAVQKKFNVKLELEICLLGFGKIRNDG